MRNRATSPPIKRSGKHPCLFPLTPLCQPLCGWYNVDNLSVLFCPLFGAEGNQGEFSAVELFCALHQAFDFASSCFFGRNLIAHLYQLLDNAVFCHEEIYFKRFLLVIENLGVLVVIAAEQLYAHHVLQSPPQVFMRERVITFACHSHVHHVAFLVANPLDCLV